MKRLLTLFILLDAFSAVSGQTFHCGDLLVDVEGNSYSTVQIGNQCWMAENLATTTYADGVAIPNGAGAPTGLGSIKYYWDLFDDPLQRDTFGLFYTWEAAMKDALSSSSNPSGIQGVCPNGWHLPSASEWDVLASTLGGRTSAGGPLKALDFWNSPNIGATDSSNFTALPSGYRSNGFGGFRAVGESAFFWSTTFTSGTGPAYNGLYFGSADITEYNDGDSGFGYNCRCLSDDFCSSASAPENPSSTFTPSMLELSWDPVINTVGCEIQAERISPPGSNASRVVSGGAPSSFTVPLAQFSAGEIWKWQVRCACSVSPLKATALSVADTFTVPTPKISSASSARVYPNPATDIICLESADQDTEVHISDLYYGVVLSQKVSANKNRCIAIDTLSEGSYVVSYWNDGVLYREVFVVKR